MGSRREMRKICNYMYKMLHLLLKIHVASRLVTDTDTETWNRAAIPRSVSVSAHPYPDKNRTS